MLRIASCTLASLVLLASSAGGIANAQRRKPAAKPACKMKFLPFVTGYTWSYQYAVVPEYEERPGGIKAKVPENLTITVKSVETAGGKTTITLEESYRTVKNETQLTCDSKSLTVPLDSFFFAGELPGALGIVTEGLELTGEMYPSAAGLKRGTSMFVSIKSDIVRTPAPGTNAKHPKAKLEIERQVTIGPSEEVEVEHGIHKSTGVEVAISGRTALETTIDKKVSLPEGNARLWFANGIGLVRAYNRLNQGWELTSFKDATGADIE